MKTTHSKKSPVGDFGEMEWLTYLDKKPVTNNSYVFFVALLDYKGQKYQSVLGSQITDKGTIDKIHNSIIKSKAVTYFLAKNKLDGDSAYSLATMTPTVFPLNIPGLNAVIVCYKEDASEEGVLAQLP